MTSSTGAPFDPPPTVEAGGMIFPMINGNGRHLVGIYSADGYLSAQYYLGPDQIYHLFVPGEVARPTIESGIQ